MTSAEKPREELKIDDDIPEMTSAEKPREELKIDDDIPEMTSAEAAEKPREELKIDDDIPGPDDEVKHQDYKMAFKLLDKDGDGTLSLLELKEVFTNLNFKFSEDELKNMVATIDRNKNGQVDLDEFMVMMRRKVSNSTSKYSLSYDDELKEAFDVFDKDGNGKITAQELADTMKALGENLTHEDIEFMMSEVDQNDDKEIDFEEFMKMMAQGPQ